MKSFLPPGLTLDPKTIGRDSMAGATAGIAAIPDAMGSAVLAGVSPVYGLYGVIVGTPLGALATGSVFMAVLNTSALAIATGEVLGDRTGEDRVQAMMTLTLMVGILQLAFGLLRLGWLTQFVSNAVMTGFLTGIGVLIILGQLGDFTGYHSPLDNKVAQAIDLLFNRSQIDPKTTLIGALTMGLILGLEHTRIKPMAMLLALMLAAVTTQLLGWDTVALVGDTSQIPRSLPTPAMPDLLLAPILLPGAFAVAIVGLVQGAGVSQSYPNPDGSYAEASRDFVGQGVANVGGGLFRALPVGGSVSGTALVVSAGACSRWANIICALCVAVAILLFGNAVELLPTSALSGLLILAGARSINVDRIRAVRRTNWGSFSLMLLTFVATLFSPLVMAVVVGVLCSMLLYVYKSVDKAALKELIPSDDGLPEERDAPAMLPGNRVTVLLPYGSLFFAGARSMEDSLPKVGDARGAVVVLLLRGRQDVGSTLIGVLIRYAQALRTNEGRLMLVGVSDTVRNQLTRTRAIEEIGTENVFPATSKYGEAYLTALSAAENWLGRERSQPSPGATGA